MKKILVIIGARGIGDLIYLLPLLRSLHKTYNQKLEILSNQVNQAKEVYLNENFYRRIKYFDNNRFNLFKTIKKIISFKKLINSYKADQLLLTSNATRLTIPVLLSNVPRKIIFGQGNFLINKDKSLNHLTNSKKLMIYTKNLRLPYKDYSFFLNKKNLSKNKNKLKNYFISVDSHHDQNNWDIKYYIELIKSLRKYNKIYINFSPNKKNLLKSFPKKFFQSKKIVFTYKKRISSIIKIIYSCDIVIGNESGPVCLASSLEKDVHAIYLPVHTKPESKIINKKNRYYNATQLSSSRIIKKIISYC